MISIVYVSSAKREFTDDELMELLRRSREKNARLDITGMLLYQDGNFMQVLEGPEDAVMQLYSSIERDARHGGILRLLKETISERQFGTWSMGFRNLRDIELQSTPGFSPFMNEPLNSEVFRDEPTRAQRLLQMFREKM